MEKEQFVAVRRNSDGDLVAFKSNTGKNMTTKQQKNFVNKDLFLMPKPLKEKVAEPTFVELWMEIKTIIYQIFQPFNFATCEIN